MLCCRFQEPCLPASRHLEFCPLLGAVVGGWAWIKAFSLSKLKVLSSPKTVGGMTAAGVSPASHIPLGKSLLSSCVGTELGEGGRPTPPAWQDLGLHPQGTR